MDEDKRGIPLMIHFTFPMMVLVAVLMLYMCPFFWIKIIACVFVGVILFHWGVAFMDFMSDEGNSHDE